MRTVGIDSATHTGLALVGDGQDRGKLIDLSKQRGFLRLQLLAQEFERTIEAWEPELAIIEGYAFCRNAKSFIVLVECGTVIKEVLYRRGIPWVEVRPTTLKQWTSGHGGATKEKMAEAAQKWGVQSHSHDVVDAFALAHMGQLGLKELQKIAGVTIFHKG